MQVSRRSRLCLLAAGGAVSAQAAASFLLPRGFYLIAFTDISGLVLLLAATAVFAMNMFVSRGRSRLFWALMSLGVAFWASYQFLWAYFEVFLRRDMPNPFGGDVVLFLHVVPMTAALAMRPHIERETRTDRMGTLDFCLLLIWWLYLYLFAVIPWQYVAVREAAYDQNLNALYLTEELVFLSCLFVFWLRSAKAWRVIYGNLFFASLAYALSSYVANWALAHKLYFSGSIYDVPLTASMAWLVCAGLVALDLPAPPQSSGKTLLPGVWVARLGMVAVSSLPLFAAWSTFHYTTPLAVRNFRLLVTLVCMLVMGSLVFLKQHLLDRELLCSLKASQESLENLTKLQTQLVQSEKLASLGQLVGGAAHELNNPLTAMMGYADLLAATPLNSEQRLLTQKIEHQVRRTKTLVSSLLSFARQTPGEKTLVDLTGLVQTALKLCPPHLRGAQVQIHTDFATDLPRVLGDSNQLLQVCLHITSNALHAMAEQRGVLTVTTRQENSTIVLEFSDNGPGLQNPDRVFDPFYTTRPVGQGAGLGLSVCYGIIHDHNGKIMCQNRAAGGATFRIELPAASFPAKALSAKSETYA